MSNIQTYSLLTLFALTFVALYNVQQHNTIPSIKLDQNIDIYELYQDWKQTYGQNKLQQGEEDGYRFYIFKLNYEFIKRINELNQKNGESLRLGLGPFTDMTNEEFQQKMGQNQYEQYNNQQNAEDSDYFIDIQEEDNEEYQLNEESQKLQYTKAEPINWTDKGAVAPIENQGACGSCWAFSSKGALEGLNQITNGNLDIFSAQMLVDCSAQNNACHGGDPMRAFYFTKMYGIELQSDYPYVSGQTEVKGECKYYDYKPVFYNRGMHRLTRPTFAGMYKYLKNQPLSIELHSSGETFQHYKQGTIMYNRYAANSLTHGVLLTGFDRDSNGGYWIVKNSWGTGWGINGYVHLQAMQNGRGTIGCQQYVAWPV